MDRDKFGLGFAFNTHRAHSVIWVPSHPALPNTLDSNARTAHTINGVLANGSEE